MCMIIKLIVIWAMMNGVWVVIVQSTCKIKNCKARCDGEFENLGNQELEAKMPFWLLQCSLAACPVRVPGLSQQLHSLNPAGCGNHRMALALASQLGWDGA